MSFEGFPLVVGWELTLACNLRCQHCGSSAGLPRDNELSLEEALSLCDQFPALLVREVDFTGGEPLLYPGWFKIAAHLQELGITTKILTNGIALNAETVARMKIVGIQGVGISLDGLEATHEYIRGSKGLFRRVLAGVECVLSSRLPLTIITTVTALNISELPSLFEMIQSMGVKRWQIQPLFPFGRSQETTELSLTEDVYLQMGEFVRHWAPKAKELGVMLLPADSFGYFTELDTRDQVWRGCPAGLYACGITSNGKVKGCLSLPDDLIEGDLRRRDLWEIWFDPHTFTYTRQYSPIKLGKNCQDCDKARICRGGCSAMSYGSTRDFHNDPYCFYSIRQRNLSTAVQC